MSGLVSEHLAEQIRRGVDPEASGVWPSDRLECLKAGGVFRWGLPPEFGGKPASNVELLTGYIDLARLCLTTTFILTQRDAACQRIAASSNLELRQRLLPDLCSGTALATVGISHLSTSRQHWSRPSVVAVRTDNGYELTGEAPWVTGARHADLLVTGATIDTGGQILVAIPTKREEVTVGEPLKLLALNASLTGTVHLNRVAVRDSEVVLGPVPQAMAVGSKGGTGSLTTTAVAIGAAARTLDGLQAEAESRPDLVDAVQQLASEWQQLRSDLLAAAGTEPEVIDLPTTAEQLRHRANSLASRAAQAFVCCAKGSGFVTGHPAERALREAMFFQVWSCPMAVTNRTLKDLVSI